MTKKQLLAVSAALLAILTLPSCFLARGSVNEPIRAAAVASLTTGKSTAAQCVQVLGGPSEVIQLGKRSAYRYDHTISKTAQLYLGIVNLTNEDSRQDRVWLFFDEDNVLTHIGSTFSSHRPEYSMPWGDPYDPVERINKDSERGLVEGHK